MIIKSKPFAIFSRRPRVESIEIFQSQAIIDRIGGTYVPTVTFFPENVVDRGLIYESEDETIATIDNTGVITAKKEGTTNIVVTSVDGYKTAELKVIVQIEEAELILNKTSHTFTKPDEQFNLSVSVKGNDTRGSVTWISTITSIATVDDNGVVTAKSPGSCVIIAEKNGIQATSEITVKQPINGIIPDTNNITVSVGATKKIKYSIIPDNATDTSVTWTSSNEKVATVDKNGNVKGIANGSATIEVSPTNNPFVLALINVDVTTSSSSITLNHSELTFNTLNQTKKLRATVLPEDATDKTVTWTSSNTSVATVDSEGNVTSVESGTCTITATNSSGQKATAKVTVSIDVESITIDKTEINFSRIGETSTITPTIAPSNATNKAVTWTSSNTSVATVSNGVVTAKGMGNATITATTHNGKTANINVNVHIPCTSITLNQTSFQTNFIGDTFSLIPVAQPTTITGAKFLFGTTDENVATVDSEGNVTIVGFGECDIIVLYDGKEAVCRVSATIIEVTGLSFETGDSCTFTKLGQTFQIRPRVIPYNATHQAISYNILTENPGFSLTEDGLITCTGILGGTIEVVTHNNKKFEFKVFTKAIEIAIGDYNDTLANLREAMQNANEKIAQVNLDIAKDNIQTDINNISKEVNKEINELGDSLTNIRDNVLEGIEDGVLTDIEKARIRASLDTLIAEKADVDAQYQELYSNTYLVDTSNSFPKYNLEQSYSLYTTRYNNLIATINAILDGGKITNTQKDMYTRLFDLCISTYKSFVSNAQKAIDAIAQRKADLVYNDAKTYTDAAIKIQSDRITSSVSRIETIGTQVSTVSSSVEILAGQINSKVDANGVTSIIQQNPESVRISFNGISSGMKVTKYGIELKTNGAIHSVLQNGRLEVMKKDGSSRLAYVGRNQWSGTNVEGCFVNSEAGCTVGIGIDNIMGLCYTRTAFQTNNGTIDVGLNIFSQTHMHGVAVKDVGSITTSNGIKIMGNYIEAPILQATSQVKAQTVHIYDWCQAKQFVTYKNVNYKARDGKTKSIKVETTCVDAITPNTEYIGSSSVIDGECTVELPIELYSQGATYVVQITPIGKKDIYLAAKDTDNFVVEGEDCDFDYVVKVSLPNVPSKNRKLIEAVKEDDFNGEQVGIVAGKVE